MKSQLLSYNTLVVHSRDHEGVNMAYENDITKKPIPIFPHDDGAVLVK